MTNHPIHVAARRLSELGPWSLKPGASLMLGFWCLVLLFGEPANAQYAIDWSTLDGGGGTSSGGNFTLTGTIGQPDAGTLSGGNYTLQGGFWPGIVAPAAGGAPALYVQLIGNSILISWSPATSGFSLEQTDSLSSPIWSRGPTGNPSTPIPAGSGTRFYRLRKP